MLLAPPSPYISSVYINVDFGELNTTESMEIEFIKLLINAKMQIEVVVSN